MTETDQPPRRGAVVTWAAFALGIAVSVAANVAHTWHPKPSQLDAHAAAGGQPGTWVPELGAQLSAAWWPIALLLCMEILQRVPWPSGLSWAAARYGGTTVVAGVAAMVSYGHMRGLLLAYGESKLTATIGPLAVDGLVVVASFGLLALSDRTRSTVVRPGVVQADHKPVDMPDQADGPGPVDQAAEPVQEDRPGVWSKPVDPPGPERAVGVVQAERSGLRREDWTTLATVDHSGPAAVDLRGDRTSVGAGGPDRVDLPVVDRPDRVDREVEVSVVQVDRTGRKSLDQCRVDQPGPADHGNVDQGRVDQSAAADPDVDRAALEAARRIVARGGQISRRTLRDEGISGGTQKLNQLARTLRWMVGQDSSLREVV